MEIERKYLVRQLPENYQDFPSIKLSRPTSAQIR